ncbi:phospholipase A2 inhibitor and Ly6/PLAUR domain-containing protein-like [Sander lucioperca]|uniref:phospholipase A2 inhibitor and Ly6/PLAUR domain-containing protein-like n=1 Tax=Sander lucioperca TaxID=283035 RepID=UPI00125E6C42|nr:phospholipase A2 inhibitor and Ly6/PLAUR domain-containing protein-like [Sander lucioperca]
MMKLILSLTLLWALSSTAGALQCQTCTDEQCNTEPLTCSSETACITASIRAKIPGTLEEQNFKACASSSLCPAPGFQTFSFNFGFESAVVSAKCCNTDNCNIDILPSKYRWISSLFKVTIFPDSQADNNLECFTCDPVTSLCTSPLQCKGVEDSCFQATFCVILPKLTQPLPQQPLPQQPLPQQPLPQQPLSQQPLSQQPLSQQPLPQRRQHLAQQQ